MNSPLIRFCTIFNLEKMALSGLLCFVSVCVLAFGTSFSFLRSYTIKANLVSTDNFSNFYAVSNNSVLKFSPDGSFLYRYDEFKYGKIGMIDVSNPMKILIFYPDFLTVITLDKFLSPLNSYNFFTLGYQNISAVASSVDGRIWVYDNIDFKLKKIEESGKVFRESQQLNTVLDQTPNPNFMFERDNKVYVNDPAIGIMVFDIFGTYSKTIPVKGLSKFQVLQDEIVYYDSSQIRSYNPLTLDVKSFSLPDTTDVQLAVLQKERLLLMKKEQIDFYRY